MPARVNNGVQSEWPGKFKLAIPTMLSDMQVSCLHNYQGTGNSRCCQWLVSRSVCPDTVDCLPTVGDSSQHSKSVHANFTQGHLSCLVFIVFIGKCRSKSYNGNSKWYAIKLAVTYKLSLHCILRRLCIGSPGKTCWPQCWPACKSTPWFSC